MNTLDSQYLTLVKHIMQNGADKKDRTGTGTKSIFGWFINHDMRNGFPILTTKKVNFKNVTSELLWFLRGETNIHPLVSQGNYIWVGDAHKNYKENWILENPPFSGPYEQCLTREEFIEKMKSDDIKFIAEWGELGPIYGHQWRKCDTKDGQVDQLQVLFDNLKNNPDSRRMIVNSWNVGELDNMVLPPCHYNFQVYTRELTLSERIEIAGGDEFLGEYRSASDELILELLDKADIPTRSISLLWNQRSVDVGLGLPYNITSYGLLLEILGKIFNMIPESLIGHLGDCHIYNNHLEGLSEQIRLSEYELPSLTTTKSKSFYNGIARKIELINQLDTIDFQLVNYRSHSAIKLPLSN